MIRHAFRRLLLEEGGWSRIWYGLATAMVIAGGGLIYHETQGGNGDGQSCPAYPSFPDASCTGIPGGTSLTTQSGDLNVTTNGATVDAMDVSGQIWVNADNVTVKNSRADRVVFSTSHTGLTVQDSEFVCPGDNRAILGGSGPEGGDPAERITVLRVDIQGCEDGLVLGDDSTVTDSYLHDPGSVGADPHNDGIQYLGSATNVRIEHNTIRWRDTSDLQMCNNAGCGTFQNVLIKNNLLYLAAGSAYNIYCPVNPSTNFVIEANAFDQTSGSIDYFTDCDGETLTGNFEYPSGNPVP